VSNRIISRRKKGKVVLTKEMKGGFVLRKERWFWPYFQAALQFLCTAIELELRGAVGQKRKQTCRCNLTISSVACIDIERREHIGCERGRTSWAARSISFARSTADKFF
jgi:hypothetical protein